MARAFLKLEIYEPHDVLILHRQDVVARKILSIKRRVIITSGPASYDEPVVWITAHQRFYVVNRLGSGVRGNFIQGV